MKNNKKRPGFRRHGQRKLYYILLMIVIICAYISGQVIYGWEWLTELMATVIAIFTAVCFLIEYSENKLLNEAQFIMDLNGQFLSDSNLSDIEWELEKYYNRYRKNQLTEEYIRAFEEKFDIENRDRQRLVNYLVHLEGIAALMNNGVIHLDAIDDLMSYRYFIAMNNPIVQKIELLEYPDYYKGCCEIYPVWVKQLLEQEIEIPMYEKGRNDLSAKLKKPENT